jgi:hypothetical protein
MSVVRSLRRWPVRAARIVLVLGLAAGLGSCTASEEGAPMDPTGGISSSQFRFLEGTWTGTWTDTRYNVSGTLQATFVVDGNDVTASGVIGLGSLGLGNETGTATGTASGNTLTFTFSSDTVGTGSGTLNTDGVGGGTGAVTGALDFGAFTFSGSASEGGISGTFNFTSPTGGNGIASLTKQ